jgi:hypothetical protein
MGVSGGALAGVGVIVPVEVEEEGISRSLFLSFSRGGEINVLVERLLPLECNECILAVERL